MCVALGMFPKYVKLCRIIAAWSCDRTYTHTHTLVNPVQTQYRTYTCNEVPNAQRDRMIWGAFSLRPLVGSITTRDKITRCLLFCVTVSFGKGPRIRSCSWILIVNWIRPKNVTRKSCRFHKKKRFQIETAIFVCSVDLLYKRSLTNIADLTF